MRILYGITANGNGHLSRSRRIVRLLRERGHEVELIISGEPGKAIMDNQDLVPYRRFDGFSFADKGGSMSALETLRASKPFRFLKNLMRDMPEGHFDLAVTDYEPLTAWHARLKGIHSVGVCRMYSFNYPGVPLPASRWYERLTFRWLAPADVMLGTHWHPYHRYIIPPFVPPVDVSAEQDRKVLVYLPWESIESYLPVLKAVPAYDFIVYGSGLPPHVEGNLEFKPQSRDGFLKDLGTCASVIANAGFALASEAASLGKRLMLKPYSGQIEQEHNAIEAERLGLAIHASTISSALVETLLKQEKPVAKAYTDITPAFVSWLETGAHDLDESTYLKLWGNVSRETNAIPYQNNLKP